MTSKEARSYTEGRLDVSVQQYKSVKLAKTNCVYVNKEDFATLLKTQAPKEQVRTKKMFDPG